MKKVFAVVWFAVKMVYKTMKGKTCNLLIIY